MNKKLRLFLVGLFSLLIGVSGFAVDYVELKPEFVLNYGKEGKLRFMKVEVSVRVKSSGSVLEINEHADLIRHQVIMIISRQSVDKMLAPEGKESVRDELLSAVQIALTEELGKPTIDSVLFTNFVIQR